MADEEKSDSIELESKMYNLFELRQRLSNDLKVYEAYIPQYDALIDIVEKSGRESELPEDFLKSIQANVDELNSAVESMKKRIAYLNILLEINNRQDEDSKKLEQWTSLLFEALGIKDAPDDVPETEAK